jgi:murein DD-endopeptidase MepM/ murein hydrolase activator NlpD
MSFLPLFKKFQLQADYKPVDLSKSNLSKLNVNPQDNDVLNNYLDHIKTQQQAKVLYGGYLEKRSLYDEKALFNGHQQNRDIHLGVDFWAEAGAEIIAPLDGVVHSFKDNTGHGNYGPCIILEHEIDDHILYTLYGHLRKKSLLKLKIGQLIEKDQPFSQLGETSENGGYLPHLHFQIMKDIQDFFGDYPGVCSEKDLEYYKSNTLDPIDFLEL